MDFISGDLQSFHAGSKSPSQSQGKPELRNLMRHLMPLASDWKNIGIFLELEHSELNTIQADYPNQSRNCLREMLNTWLKKFDPEPTWQAVAEAVELLGDQQKAKEIRDKFVMTSDKNTFWI